MSTPRPTADEPFLSEPGDFSLILGGPLYQLWRGRVWSETPRRRVIVLALLVWVPVLRLLVAVGHAWGDRVKLPSRLSSEERFST